MRLTKLQRILPSIRIGHRNLNTTSSEEYTKTPEYPPILDLSVKAKEVRKLEQWSNAVQALKTVEEKQLKLNMPRYYGWKCIMLDDLNIPYNAMHFVQHCTRTHFKEVKELPDVYKEINLDSILPELKSAIEEAICFEVEGHKRAHEIYQNNVDEVEKENIFTRSVVRHLNRILLNNLSPTKGYLIDAQIDFEPRHEAFWFVGGIQPPEVIRKSRLGRSFLKDRADEPVDRSVQYLGIPTLAVRTERPLQPFISASDASNPDLEVPFFEFDPKVLGFNTTHRFGTNIPGFWPGDSCEFGQLSYQKRSHMLTRLKSFGERDNQEALHCQGMASSFAWLQAQASYQGFTTFNDLTYPLVAQTIITNGQKWSFYTYQLNTVLLHSNHVRSNPKRNVCWGLSEQKLYEQVDPSGKLVGFNDDVLKNLLRFYLNEPKDRGIELKPFLGKDEQVVANIKDAEKRDWLEKQYKYMMSNRPRSKLPYEIYHWEKIYKIDHNTRVLEARKRPFELNVNPWKRKYNEHGPNYIPKCLRPGGPKSKEKFYKTYHP